MTQPAEAHALLEVPYGASTEEINKAWKRKAKSVHPDVNPSPDASAQFKRLTQARDRLLLQDEQAPPSMPSRSERYQPARQVDDERAEQLLRENRRRREAEERRRKEQQEGVKRRARQAERSERERLQKLKRRRAAQETEERTASPPPRAQPPQPNGREAEAQRAEQERLAKLRRDEASREPPAPIRRTPPRPAPEPSQQPTTARAAPTPTNQIGRCAWKGCEITRGLAEPIETALGLRRFCNEHREAYRQMNVSRRSRKRRRAAPR